MANQRHPLLGSVKCKPVAAHCNLHVGAFITAVSASLFKYELFG